MRYFIFFFPLFKFSKFYTYVVSQFGCYLLEILDLCVDFMKFTIERVDSYPQIVPSLLTIFTNCITHISFLIYMYIN